ncbi:MAG: bifunctional 2-polyprenyl-6-hydroxyphenol methylase/3-demethylubiquinol 3-O-methyltransferase UbiG [Terricaulis sp.]
MAHTAPPSTTIDTAEVEKFSALAAQWWDPTGPFGALHRMNPVRLGFIRDRALKHFSPPPCGEGLGVGVRAAPSQEKAPPSPPSLPSPARGEGRGVLAGLTALDIGCGGGLVSAPLARMGAKVTGLDASEEAIGAARAHADATGLDIDFQAGTAEALVESGAQFNLVTALEIIEHVSDVGAFLDAASALVKPGGLIVLSTINRTQKARALAIVGAERILKWAPEGAHDYDKLVTPDEIRAGAPAIVWDEPVGLTYNPLGAGWSLSRDTTVNYLMAGVKPK